MQVLAEPLIAGPGESIRFIVQVANVGYGPARDVTVEAELPALLTFRSAECGGCPVSQVPGGLTITVGELASGDQVFAFVLAAVVEDAWPGQMVETVWDCTAANVKPRTSLSAIELPWAELPGTGSVGRIMSGNARQGWMSRCQ